MSAEDPRSFWDHLEEFRKVLFRCLIVWFVGAALTFCFKSLLFQVLFAPSSADFVSYRGLCRLAQATGWEALCPSAFEAQFINTELAAQFMTHIKVALWAGLVITFPFLLVQLYGFIVPALYEREKRYTMPLLLAGTLLFLMGVLLNYFVIFPFSFRFLANYQVYGAVENHISLSSYISAFVMLSLLMGLLFEIPILNYFLAKMGLLTAETLKKYRRHAIVGICIVAAVITPTGDAVTLMLVTLPIYLLYEASIHIVKKTTRRETAELRDGQSPKEPHPEAP